MDNKPTKSDLQYQLRKLEQKREEAKKFETQYRPGTRQYLDYKSKGEGLDAEIKTMQDRIAAIADQT